MEMRTLIDTATLARHLDDPDWLVVDVRHQLTDPSAGRRAYLDGHIPGAFFLHLDVDLSGAKTGSNGRHPLPTAAAFGRTFRRIGLDEGKTVVIYDDAGGMFAARMWWMLRWVGFFGGAVLDGGWSKWQRERRLVSYTEPPPSASDFHGFAQGQAWVDADFVAQHLQTPDMLLVDARSPDRFAGDNETLDPVGGHIPGALNRFFQSNLEPSGCFLSPGQLRAAFRELLGDIDPRLVVHQCGSGVTACHNLLAMELAGMHGSRLYPGSWSEWCSDPARPIAGKGGVDSPRDKRE